MKTRRYDRLTVSVLKWALICGCIGCITAQGVGFQRELAAQTPANFKFSRQGFILFLVMTVLIMDFSALLAQTPLPTIRKTFATLQIGSGWMPYWRNRPIDAYDPRVTRAIIVIHGSGGNAEGYFDRINNIIPTSWSDKVMVIAPHFQEESEAGSDEYWWDGDWREGGASGGISSYAVVDHIVGLLRNGNFPNLKWIVIGGHSAGGQFSALRGVHWH
jgi:poly(3-hydroxybutyrate) depolymerase